MKRTPLYVLRQKTGLAYNLCREALDKHDNDVDKAASWLEIQAMSLGLQKATKVRGRSAREGLIGIAIRNDNKLISLLELNCETDFVAKNQIFKDFASELTEKFAISSSDCIEESIPNQKHIIELKPTQKVLEDISSQIPPLISKLGENIIVKRAHHLKAIGDDKTQLFGQVHAKACQRQTGGLDLILGRFGAFIGLRPTESHVNSSIKEIGHRLCQHVIGYNPRYIELPDSLREQLELLEKERAEKLRSQEAKDTLEEHDDVNDDDSDKDELNETNRDEWPSMMDQTLIMSEDQSVRDFCNEKCVSIVYFNRVECGEVQ